MSQAAMITVIPLLVLLSSLLPQPTLATEFQFCDKEANYDVKVQGFEISPNRVTRGKPATFSISASTENALSRGNVTIDVSFFGFLAHSETHDLCTETACPVSSGDFIISHSQVLPGYTPPGKYSVTMKIMTGEHQLSCINFDLWIAFWSPTADI